jgi:hypothetical protein
METPGNQLGSSAKKPVSFMIADTAPTLPGLTCPGGRMASNRSTPNIPRLESVKVPANFGTGSLETLVPWTYLSFLSVGCGYIWAADTFHNARKLSSHVIVRILLEAQETPASGRASNPKPPHRGPQSASIHLWCMFWFQVVITVIISPP